MMTTEPCAVCGSTRRGYTATEYGKLCSRHYWQWRRGTIDPAALIANRQATEARFRADREAELTQ